MRIHKSVKNIFLGITFLCIFLLPNATEAYDKKAEFPPKTIEKPSTQMVRDSTGSTIKYNSFGTSLKNSFTSLVANNPAALEAKLVAKGFDFDVDAITDTGKIVGDNISYNLYRKNYKKTTETGLDSDVQEEILSKYNKVNPNVDIDKSTIFSRNSGDVTEYGYVDKSGKRRFIMSATEKGEVYITKGAGVDESENYNELKKIRNSIDVFEDRNTGTTEDNMTRAYNATKQQEKINSNIGEIDKAINTWEQQPDSVAKTEAIDALKKARGEAVTDLNKQQSILNAEQAKIDNAYNQTKCDSVLKIFDFYCLSFTIAKFTNIIFKLMSFVTYIVGTLFDYSLELSINSAEFFKKLGVVEITWSFLRDILNITFIFILLWAAIQILIGNEAQYNAKKVLMNVVLVAILINFSLFAAKIMVDGSNIVSLKLYETMKAGTAEKTASISERVMNTVGLTALYDINQIFADTTTFAQQGGACQNNPGALITISVMGSIFLVILCLALGLAAVLFLIRLVNIIILFIKSPLWVWGYVLPGSRTVSKFKDEWQAEMKHVLVFPIAYMFWMLVAIIIFEKLGKVNQGVNANGSKVTLLDLICSSPGTGGLSQSISLVAIFAIVIIFMMQAIKYGVKNAAGTGNGVGSSLGNAAAKKFGGWQDAITKGIAKKTWDKTSGVAVAAGSLAAGAGIGAAKGSLVLAGRTGVGTIKGLGSMGGDKGFRKGFSEGFLNPGINTKEWLRDAARSQVANGGIVGELTGLTSKAAKFADKYKDPVNMDGETKKQAEERRTKKSAEDEKLRYAAIDNYYKIDSQKDWLAKPKNKGKTIDDYEKYVDKILEQRTDAILGRGVSQKEGKADKDGKRKTHLEEIKEAAKKEMVDDKGNKQIKINEYAMHGALEDIIKYRSEGEGLKSGDLTDGKKRLEVMRNRKAQARIKAGLGAAIKGSKTAAFSKKNESEKTEDFNKKIKALQEKIKELPDVKDIDELIKTKTKYVGVSENENGIKDLNKAIDAYNRATSGSSPNPDIVAKCERDIEAAKKKYAAHVENKKSALIKEEEKLGNHLKAIDEKENKDKK